MTPTNSDRLWTRAFVLLCLVQFFGYAQHFVLQPTLPIYITHLAGTPFVVGLVMAAFAVASLLLRSLVGYWSDRWSEARIMISGLLIQGSSVLLCFVPWIGIIMLANGLRGIGWRVSTRAAMLSWLTTHRRRAEIPGLIITFKNRASLNG